jgi:hypothetical protein
MVAELLQILKVRFIIGVLHKIIIFFHAFFQLIIGVFTLSMTKLVKSLCYA